jgi:putative polyhydroxyalkanoate system protein
MRIAVEHHTTKENARQKVEQRLEQLLSQFGGHADEMEHQWFGDTLQFKGKARGFAVEGSVEVTKDEVIFSGKLPLIAKMFEGKIKHAIQKETDSMFA